MLKPLERYCADTSNLSLSPHSTSDSSQRSSHHLGNCEDLESCHQPLENQKIATKQWKIYLSLIQDCEWFSKLKEEAPIWTCLPSSGPVIDFNYSKSLSDL